MALGIDGVIAQRRTHLNADLWYAGSVLHLCTKYLGSSTEKVISQSRDWNKYRKSCTQKRHRQNSKIRDGTSTSPSSPHWLLQLLPQPFQKDAGISFYNSGRKFRIWKMFSGNVPPGMVLSFCAEGSQLPSGWPGTECGSFSKYPWSSKNTLNQSPGPSVLSYQIFIISKVMQGAVEVARLVEC